MSRLVLSEITWNDLLDQAGPIVAAALDVEHAAVWEWEPRRRTLRLQTGMAAQEDPAPSPVMEVPASSALESALLGAEPAFISGLAPAAPAAIPPFLQADTGAAGLLAAIPGSDRPYGLLAAYSSKGRTFAEGDAAVLQTAANLLAAARQRREAAPAAQLAAIIAASPDAMVIIDEAGIIRHWTPATERLYGYTPEEAIGQSVSMLLPPGHPPILPGLERLRRGETIPAREVVRRTKDGRNVHVSLSMFPVPGGAAAVVRDITAPKQAEAALRASEERFRQLAESLGDFLWLLRLDPLEMLYVSPAYERIWGRPLTDFQRNPLACTESLPLEDREAFLADLEAARRGEFAGGEREYRVFRPDGEVRWVLERCFPVRDAAGKTTHLSGVVLDITERKQTQARQLQLAQEQAARAVAEDRERRARFLAEAGKALASSLDVAATLQTVAELAVPHLADWCVINIADDEGLLRPTGWAHADPAQQATLTEMVQRYPLRAAWPHHPGAAALRTRATQVVEVTGPGWGDAVAVDAQHAGLLRALRPASYISVPLIAHGKLVGLFNLARVHEDRSFDAADIAAAEELASGAALAIDHALLYQAARQAEEAARREATRQAVLAQAAQLFSQASLDYPAALRTIAQHLAEVVGDLCIIRLLSEDEDAPHLRAVAVWHPDAERRALLERLYAAPPRRAEAGLAGKALASGLPVRAGALHPDTLAPSTRSEHEEYLARFGFHNVLVAPLRVRRGAIGVLTLIRDRPGQPYTEEDEAFLQRLADRAALAVDNARLYQQADQERRQLDAVLDQIPESVLIASAETGAIRFNRRGRRGWRWVSGQGDGDALPPLALDAFNKEVHEHWQNAAGPDRPIALARALRTGEVTLGEEAVIIGADGRRRVFLLNAAPVRDEQGRITAAVATMQDITDRKTVEEQKDGFLHLVAHELNTPLAVLVGQAHRLQGRLQRLESMGPAILKRTRVDLADLSAALEDMGSSAEDMARLVRDLLDLGRIDLQRLTLQPEPLDLAALLRAAVARQAAAAPGARLALEGAEQPVWGRWDRARLEQVFTNLLTNAVKYSAAGTPVTVRLAAGTAEVQVTVADRGIGIPAADLPHIFDRHFRASNVDAGHTGLGLGLHLTKQIVERHGGRIWAESEKGQGSVFSVALPIEAAAP